MEQQDSAKAPAETLQVKFIRSELELGLTLVQLARAQRSNGNGDDANDAVARAQLVLANVCHFLGLLRANAAIRSELKNKAEYLAFVIEEFSR